LFFITEWQLEQETKKKKTFDRELIMLN